MKQLSFEFMADPKYKEIKKSSQSEEVHLTKDQILQEANALADVNLNISGMDALCMAARGDFYDTDIEGSLLHSKLRRLVALLNW